MKRNFLIIATLLASLLLLSEGHAAHIIGGEISYECLGKTPRGDANRYRITMKIYRDCLGGGADFDSVLGSPFNASVTIHRDIDSLFQIIELDDPPVVRSVEPSSDPCLQIPSNICVEEGVYVFEVELAIINASYHIVYQRCCRNSTINNITDPGLTGSTYTTEITAASQQVCNTSPVFDDVPPIVICVGNPLSISSSATDSEGDSLVYEFCSPFVGGGPNANLDVAFTPQGIAPNPEPAPPYDNVNFVSPTYTIEQPLGVASNLEIGVNSGLITGMPAILGQFVIAVCVYEYRDGELLSLVRRDFQINVTECTPKVTAIIQADSTDMMSNSYFFQSCGANELTFINESVVRSNILANFWRFDLAGDTIQQTTWDATINFPAAGQYAGQLILNPNTLCGDTANIIVDIYPELAADFTFAYDSCVATPVQFQDESIAGSDQITSWEWSFGDNAMSDAQNPIHEYQTAATFEVTLKIKDDNQCVSKTTQLIPYFPVPEALVVDPSIFEGCAPQDILFTNLSTPLNEQYTIFWDFGDGNSSSEISPLHTYDEAGIYDVSLSVVSPVGCEISTIYEDWMSIDFSPTAAFSFTPEQPDLRNPTIRITDESVGANGYEWFLNNAFITQETEPTYTFQDTGLQIITLVVTHESGCQDSSTAIIDIAPDVFLYVPNVFAPAGSAENSEFRGLGILPNIRDYQMLIWDRWGNLIFETNDPEVAWRGNVQSNEAAPQGVYVYVIEFTGARGQPYQYTGSVTLIR
ncbi:MAG: PKD domain-containing protein [Bacteroidota bacterium]